MNILTIENKVVTIQLSVHELNVLNNALNEVCNGLEIPEFSTRMGAEIEEVLTLLNQINVLLSEIDVN